MIVKVKQGDTLARLADAYHTTVAAICTANRLENEHVEVGMRLAIEGHLRHVWMPTDTVEDVAALYGVAPDAIRNANPHVAVGVAVKIPI